MIRTYKHQILTVCFLCELQDPCSHHLQEEHMHLAGFDGKGNFYQTQSVSCQTSAPTICRKNIGIYQLHVSPMQLTGSDEKGNLYKTQTVSCQTSAPTICRKNISNYQLPVSPDGRI